jgi:hypothetical protein
MNQRKILYLKKKATPNGEGSTALPVSLNFKTRPKVLENLRSKLRGEV